MDQDVTFAQDVRPLFRERDVSSMSSRFDLSSYDDVVANAETSTSGSRTARCPAMAHGRRPTSSAFARGWIAGSHRSPTVAVGWRFARR